MGQDIYKLTKVCKFTCFVVSLRDRNWYWLEESQVRYANGKRTQTHIAVTYQAVYKSEHHNAFLIQEIPPCLFAW